MTELFAVVPDYRDILRRMIRGSGFSLKRQEEIIELGRLMVMGMVINRVNLHVWVRDGQIKRNWIDKHEDLEVDFTLRYMFKYLDQDQQKEIVDALRHVMVSMLGGTWTYNFTIRWHHILKHNLDSQHIYYVHHESKA